MLGTMLLINMQLKSFDGFFTCRTDYRNDYCGSILGLLAWVFVASIVTFVGRWLGGQGTVKEFLIATGISYIPIVLLLSLNIVDLLLLGENIFITKGHALWLMFSGILASVVGVWNIVISLKSIGEAHRFSAWRALAFFIYTTHNVLGRNDIYDISLRSECGGKDINSLMTILYSSNT